MSLQVEPATGVPTLNVRPVEPVGSEVGAAGGPPAPEVGRDGSAVEPVDVLTVAAREVASELTAAGRRVSRDALAAGLRARGHSIGTDRAARLARTLAAALAEHSHALP